MAGYAWRRRRCRTGDGRAGRAARQGRRRHGRGRYRARPCASVLDTVKIIKKHASDTGIGGRQHRHGGSGQRISLKAGVDAVKVGVGPGSICTTRIVSGAGMPQLTAIADCAKVLKGSGVPIIADGGSQVFRRYHESLAAGASAVMFGGLFAGTEESPGETVLYQARTYKVYRGMGSIGAMERGGGDRYWPERASAPKSSCLKASKDACRTRDPCRPSSTNSWGASSPGMGYCGCKTIPDLQKNATFIRQTVAGLRESHVHDVIITKEAPNYRMDWE